jgi:hypothetical protein
MEVYGMKEVIKKAIDHPIATIFIADTVLSGIARIVWAIRGGGQTTVVTTGNTTTG